MKSRWIHSAAMAALTLCALSAAPVRADDGSHGAVSIMVSGGTRWLTADGVWRRFAFNARQYADGFVNGEWQLVAGAAIVHGNVTCLNVLDDQNARVGGTIENAKFTGFRVGTDIGWIAADRGEGQSGQGDLTSSLRAFLNAPPGSAEQWCTTGMLPFPGGDLAIDTIDKGNIQIIRMQ
jgi:hypothetical protein